MTLRERLVRFRSFWIFPLLASLLFYLTSRGESKSRFNDLFWLMPVGILIWTLLEYALHRFVFHIQFPVRNPRLREIVNASHLAHHASPRDPRRLLVHPLYGLAISTVLYAGLLALSRNAFSAAGLTAGIWTGFLYSDAVDHRVQCCLLVPGFLG